MQSLDSDGSAESDAVLEEAFATAEGIVEPVEGDEAEARLTFGPCILPPAGYFHQNLAQGQSSRVQLPARPHAYLPQRLGWAPWQRHRASMEPVEEGGACARLPCTWNTICWPTLSISPGCDTAKCKTTSLRMPVVSDGL